MSVGKHANGRRPLGKLALLLALAMVVSAFAVGPLAGAGDKSYVCHVEGTGDYHLINISDAALDKHIAHGDYKPGDPIPGVPGEVFGDACESEAIDPVQVADGYFSNIYPSVNGYLLTTSFLLYQEWDSSYSGTGSYTYPNVENRSLSMTITDACVDGNNVTVRGTVTANWTSDGFGFLSVKNNGNDTYSTRAGTGSEGDIDGLFTLQCGGSALFPATGPVGHLTFP